MIPEMTYEQWFQVLFTNSIPWVIILILLAFMIFRVYPDSRKAQADFLGMIDSVRKAIQRLVARVARLEASIYQLLDQQRRANVDRTNPILSTEDEDADI